MLCPPLENGRSAQLEKLLGEKDSIENRQTYDTGEILKEIEARMNADDSEITVDHDQDDYERDINYIYVGR